MCHSTSLAKHFTMNVTANLKQAENTQIKKVIFIGVLQPDGEYFSVLFLIFYINAFLVDSSLHMS